MSEMRSDDPVHFDEALRLPGGLEAPHALLSFACRLMRVLGPVVQIPVLPVSDAGHDHSFRGCVAAQLVRYDHPRTTATVGLQQLAEESHGCETVSLWLDQNIDHNTFLIHGPPQIMPHTINVQKHLIEMPLVAGPVTSSSQARRVQVAELFTPAPDAFIANQHPA